MKIGSLFSGAGGLDMAVEEVFGGEAVWHCEVDAAAAKVLEHRWPGVPNHRDVTATDWDTVEPADILCGGYPCQPFSQAGQRKGTDDVRHLWPYFAEAIRRIRPRYVVLENVAGHRVVGFDQVLADLARLGFDAEWCSLRACDVGAPHRRERLFVVATDSSGGGLHWGTQRDLGSSAGFPAPQWRDADRRGVEDARLELLPTPKAHDGMGGAKTAEQVANDPHQPSNLNETAQNILANQVGWGKYAPAVERWEKLTRSAPAATTDRTRTGKPRLNPAFSEWLMGWPKGWVTDLNELSRSTQLRIIGNGVCPQQASAALSALALVTQEGQKC